MSTLHAGLRYEAIARVAGSGADALKAGDLTPYEARVFSQNGEDGVLAEILRRIGVTERWFIEFGAASGIENNCVFLADVLGWHGLFIECADDAFSQLAAKYRANANVQTVCAMVTPDNVEQLFSAAGVPTEPDVLSIDVDGPDWWIWRAITSYRPRVVVTEYNSNLAMEARVTVPQDHPGWDGTTYFGASLGAFEVLASSKGYELVHTDLSGVNAFWVRADLMRCFDGIDPPRRAANYWLSGMRMPAASQDSTWVDVDDVL